MVNKTIDFLPRQDEKVQDKRCKVKGVRYKVQGKEPSLTEIQLHFYFDQAGDPRARCDPPYELLGHFLESDVQTSRKFCRDILEACDQIASHKLDSWQITGNAHTLIITKNEARIESEFDDSAAPCRMSIKEFRDAVMRWFNCIKNIRTW